MPHQPTKRIIADADTAILFVHGIVGSPDHFLPLLPLVPENWSCVNLLLPGHGGSVSDFSRSSMSLWRSFVHEETAALATAHRRVVLVGHSMGTLFCIDESLRLSGTVCGQFLLACPLYPQLTPPAMAQSLQVAFDLPSRSAAAIAAREACSVHTSRRLWEYFGWAPRYCELFQAAAQGRQQILRTSIPTTAVQSGKDELVSRRSSRLLEQSDAVTLLTLPDARHFYYPPEELAALQQHFSAFLAQFK